MMRLIGTWTELGSEPDTAKRTEINNRSEIK